MKLAKKIVLVFRILCYLP